MVVKNQILKIIRKRRKQMQKPSNISPYAKTYALTQFKKLIEEVENV